MCTDRGLVDDVIALLRRPGDGQPREGGHIMARLSLGQLLIGLASAQEEGGRRHAAGGPLGIAAAGGGGGGGGGGGTRQQEALQSQRRLLLELGSLMLTRMNPAGAGGAGDDGPPMATPTGQWACVRHRLSLLPLSAPGPCPASHCPGAAHVPSPPHTLHCGTTVTRLLAVILREGVRLLPTRRD